MSFEKSRIQLHAKIDMHAKLHLAAIKYQVINAQQRIAGLTEFHLRSIAQKRRWRNYQMFNEQGGSTK